MSWFKPPTGLTSDNFICEYIPLLTWEPAWTPLSLGSQQLVSILLGILEDLGIWLFPALFRWTLHLYALLLYDYSRLFLYFSNQPLDLLLSVTWGSIVTAVVYPESPCNHEPWIVSAVIPKWFEFSTGSMASGFSEAQSITKASHCLIHQDLQQCSALSSVVSAWRSSVVIGCPFIFISL